MEEGNSPTADVEGDGFKRLFPKISESHLSHPLQTEVVVAMCNVAQYAFGAYENPTVDGFKETVIDNAYIQYLNPDAMDQVFDGFLTIRLEKATSLPRGWWWERQNDPYVLFSVGSSIVRSETVFNSNEPVWNATLFLPIRYLEETRRDAMECRKRSIKVDEGDVLTVSLFDDDKHKGWSLFRYLANTLDKDDLLGTAQLDIEKLKQPGERIFDLVVTNHTTVHMTTEYISSEIACEAMGLRKDGPAWMHTVGNERRDVALASACSWVLDLGHLCAAPYAYFENSRTDTQAWMHVYPHSKTVLVSFRGTEKTKLMDVLLDLTAFPSRLGATRSTDYTLTPTPSLLDDDIRVHSGFLLAYESIREQILQVICDVTQWSDDWNICCTGHSLGGALATLAAFEFKNRKNADGKGPSIAMMNYGSPRVGNRAFVTLFDACLVHSYRVVDREDIIHLIPPGYIHSAKELLCRPTGEVLIEGVKLSDCDRIVLTPKICKATEDFEDTGSLEEILSKYGLELGEVAEKHVTEHYLCIVGRSVSTFFENKPRSMISSTPGEPQVQQL